MNSKTVLSYLGIFILSVLVFLVILFPQERIAARLSQNLSHPGGDVQTVIERVRPSFPNVLRFENTRIIFKNQTEIKPESLAVRLNPGLMFNDNKKIRFFSIINSGEVKGSIEVEKGHANPIKDIDVEIDGIQIESYRYNTRMADITLNCEIDGKYSSLQNDSRNTAGQGSLNITGFNADLKRSLFNRLKMPKIDFSTIDVEFAKSGRTIDVKALRARGSVINVNLKGRITLGKNSSDTRLSLTGNILSDSPFLENLVNSAIVRAVAKNAQKSGIRFSIKGTLEQPRITL